MTCYEACTGPDNTDVPRIDRWGHYTESGQFCDYSGVPMSTRIQVRACSLIMSARSPVSRYLCLSPSPSLSGCCCCCESKGTKDLDIYSHADSDSLSVTLSVALAVNLIVTVNTDCGL